MNSIFSFFKRINFFCKCFFFFASLFLTPAFFSCKYDVSCREYAKNVEFSAVETDDGIGMIVSMSTETENADIYYTIDGSEPDFTSQKYIEPLLVLENRIIKAFAFKN